MKKMITLVVICAIMLGALLMTGCSTVDTTKLAVTLLIADKFGDQGIFDSAKTGADSLANDFAIDMKPSVECGGSDYSAKIKQAAEESDVIICVGDAFTDRSLAEQYPDDRFIWVGAASSDAAANAVNVVCAPEDTGSAVYSALAVYINGNTSHWGTTWNFNKDTDAVETQAPTEAETTGEPTESEK